MQGFNYLKLGKCRKRFVEEMIVIALTLIIKGLKSAIMFKKVIKLMIQEIKKNPVNVVGLTR